MTNFFIKHSLKPFGQFKAVLPPGSPSDNRVLRLHRRWPPSYKKHCMLVRLVSLGIWTAYMAEYPAKSEAKAPLGSREGRGGGGAIIRKWRGNRRSQLWTTVVSQKNLITIFLQPENQMPPTPPESSREYTTTFQKLLPQISYHNPPQDNSRCYSYSCYKPLPRSLHPPIRWMHLQNWKLRSCISPTNGIQCRQKQQITGPMSPCP